MFSAVVVIVIVVIVKSHRSLFFPSSFYTQGRGHEADIRLPDISVSRLHAFLRFKAPPLRRSGTPTLMVTNYGGTSFMHISTKSCFVIEDNRSKFGTLLAVKKPFRLDPQYPVPLSFQTGRTLITVTFKKRWRFNFPACLRNSQADIVVLMKQSAPLTGAGGAAVAATTQNNQFANSTTAAVAAAAATAEAREAAAAAAAVSHDHQSEFGDRNTIRHNEHNNTNINASTNDDTNNSGAAAFYPLFNESNHNNYGDNSEEDHNHNPSNRSNCIQFNDAATNVEPSLALTSVAQQQ